MTTRQQQAMSKLKAYNDYANNIEVHTRAKEGSHIHSGAHGVSFEMAVKIELGNYRFVSNASKMGHRDTIKKLNGDWVSFEIKQGSGELATIDENGDIKRSVFSADYVIYAPDYRPNDDVRKMAYILTGENFAKAVEVAGMARFKKSTAMTRWEKANDEEGYYDRITLQSFTNSHKKLNAWYEALEDFGETFGKWLEKQDF